MSFDPKGDALANNDWILFNEIDDLNQKLREKDKYIEELEPYKMNYLSFESFRGTIERRNKEIETSNYNLENEIKELQQLVVNTFKEKGDEIKGLRKIINAKDDEAKKLR